MPSDLEIIKAALAKGPTPKWFTAGREDMQSYSIGGRPFKNLYNDDIAGTSEAARVEGDNSIPDSQFIAACSPDRIARLVERIEHLESVKLTPYLCKLEKKTADYEAALKEIFDGPDNTASWRHSVAALCAHDALKKWEGR